MSESKEESLVHRVQDFCLSSELESEFEDFARENGDVFRNNNSASKDGDEYPLEYFEIYQAYLRKFEARIERFIEKEGYTISKFYEECKKILNSDDIFDAQRFFIEALLATSEYEHFVMLMKSEMRTSSRK